MQNQTLNVLSTDQQALSDYLDVQIQTYYNNIQLSFEFLSEYEPELEIFCDMKVSDIYTNTENHFNIDEFNKNLYKTQSGGSTIADKIVLLNKMFRSSASIDLKIESGICELFKKVAQDGDFIKKLTKGIKKSVNVVVSTVDVVVQTYNNLSFEAKINGVQNVLKGLLKMIWNKFIQIWKIPPFSVSDIRDTPVFCNKLINFIESNLKINNDNQQDKTNKPTLLISVADFVGRIIAMFTKNMNDNNEVEDLTFLVDYVAIIKDDASFLVLNRLEDVNMVSQEDYTIHKIKGQLKTRKHLLTVRKNQLTAFVNQGYTQRERSLLRTDDALGFLMEMEQDMSKDMQFIKFYNNLVNELLWIIKNIPNYNTNADLSAVVENDIMKEALKKLNDISPPDVKLPIPNVFKNVGAKIIGFISRFTGGLPDINIPFHELFGLCTFGLSAIFDNLDVFTGGILQLINISLMLLHYVISFNSKQYIKSLSAITGQKTTMNARMKEQIKRMKDNNIQHSKLPPIIFKRGGTLPPIGQLPSIRKLPPIGRTNQTVFSNTPNTYSTYGEQQRLKKELKDDSNNRENIGLTVGKIKLNDREEYDLNSLMVTTIQLIKSDLYTVHSQNANEHNNKVQDLVIKYVLENKDIELSDLSADIHAQSVKFLGPNTTRIYQIPQHTDNLLTLNYKDEFVKFATDSIVDDNLEYIKQYHQEGGNKRKRLSPRQLQEINNFLVKIGKEDLYKYCKLKNIKVSSGMRKHELINSIISNHKQM
jgi:hypothetical protein